MTVNAGDEEAVGMKDGASRAGHVHGEEPSGTTNGTGGIGNGGTTGKLTAGTNAKAGMNGRNGRTDGNGRNARIGGKGRGKKRAKSADKGGTCAGTPVPMPMWGLMVGESKSGLALSPCVGWGALESDGSIHMVGTARPCPGTGGDADGRGRMERLNVKEILRNAPDSSGRIERTVSDACTAGWIVKDGRIVKGNGVVKGDGVAAGKTPCRKNAGKAARRRGRRRGLSRKEGTARLKGTPSLRREGLTQDVSADAANFLSVLFLLAVGAGCLQTAHGRSRRRASRR
jgi:hypothetical protein